MDTSKLFSEKSDLYASARPRYPSILFDWIAAQSPETARVWDCGTGNGQAAIGLAAVFNQVEASDISEEQIAHALYRPNVIYSVQPAEKTEFEENAFDTVHVAQALHWFDYDRFWPEVKRVLKPSGLFVGHGYGWASVSDIIDTCVDRNHKTIVEPYWPPQRDIMLSGFTTIPFPFAKIETPAFSLTMQWNLDQYFDYMHTWSATRLCMKAMGKDFFHAAKEATCQVWGDPAQKKPVHFPMRMIAGYHR